MFAAMATMRAVQISRPGGPLELVERPIPEPGQGMVRVKVEACGICHSDVVVKEGLMPLSYPRVPGHEVAGVVDALGPGVSSWAEASAWASGGTAASAECARLAGAAISSPA